MWLEPLFAIIIWAALSLLIPVYLRRYAIGFERDRAFERWCSHGPVVLALCAREGREAEVNQAIADFVGGGEVSNPAGVGPWPLYLYRLKAQAISSRVSVVRVMGCRPLRGDRVHPRTLDGLLSSLAAGADGPLECYWQHRALVEQAHPLPAEATSSGWLGLRDDSGAFHPQPTEAPPRWMAAVGPLSARPA